MEKAARRILITVAICTRNRARSLSAAVESVLAQLDGETELLLVDNGSTDETPRLAAAFAAQNPAVRVVREMAPGVAMARNTALAQARGDYVLFFDDDELAEPGWLSAYQQFLGAPPTERLGCVGGPYLVRHEAPVPSWLDADFGSFDLGPRPRRLTGTTSPAGGNCAYSRRAALQVGGFATELVRHEDSELNERLRAAGYDLWGLPAARIVHIIPAARCRMPAQIRLWFAEGKSIVAMRLRQTRSPGARRSFLAGRCLVTPFQLVVQLVGAALCGVVLQRRSAARLFLRAMRSAGLFAQVVHEICRRSRTGILPVQLD